MTEKYKPRVAVLLPTYDELGVTLDLSILNLYLRMAEVQNISWAFLICVNGTEKLEEVARLQTLVQSSRSIHPEVIAQVHHISDKGKEKAMNHIARAASTVFDGQGADMHIGTDVKVYRTPNSFNQLIRQFQQKKDEVRYLGASVLPYPVDVYKSHYELTAEQELFYRLVEIDKHPTILKFLPKTHIRGGLYITGAWQELYTDAPDDYTLSRRSRLEHGPDSVQLTTDAVGYVIPRQSFADYFAVRLKRSIPAEESLKITHPDIADLRDNPAIKAQETSQLEKLHTLHPELHALYLTKKILDKECRRLALDMENASEIMDQFELELKASFIPQTDMSIEAVSNLALIQPRLAALAVIVHYRAIVEALVVDRESVSYGPREERYRGMLPLDIDPR